MSGCGYFETETGVCGATPTRRYLPGDRCEKHTPSVVDGHPEARVVPSHRRAHVGRHRPATPRRAPLTDAALRRHILELLELYGAMTDEALLHQWNLMVRSTGWPRVRLSTLRAGRASLLADAKVRPTGEAERPYPGGPRSPIWELTPSHADRIAL